MRIKVKIGEDSHECELVDGAAALRIPAVKCDTCDDLFALRDGYGRVRGLFHGWSGMEDERSRLEAQHGRLTSEEPPSQVPGFSILVIMGARIENSHGYTGEALCERCRRKVGDLTVEDSLHGHEEDRRVVSGPWKVF